MAESFALYATCYPGVEKYLSQWRDSVLAQTDSDVTVCIGLEGMSPDWVQDLLGPEITPRFIAPLSGEAPASLRSRALLILAGEFDAVILTDMDDVLLPTRIASAKDMLATSDLCCCAMQVMDGERLVDTAIFDPGSQGGEPFRRNVFGLTNTVWRAHLLRECLPVPPDCVLMDWLLATRAWAADARITYDRVPRMIYRQYANNTARILPPFPPEQILKSCRLVLDHYNLVAKEASQRYPRMVDSLALARQTTDEFCHALRDNNAVLSDYVRALNELPPHHVWWECVAHPALEHIWKH